MLPKHRCLVLLFDHTCLKNSTYFHLKKEQKVCRLCLELLMVFQHICETMYLYSRQYHHTDEQSRAISLYGMAGKLSCISEMCTTLVISPFIHVMDNHFYRLTVKWFGGSNRRIWAFLPLKYTWINHNVLPASSFLSLLQMYLSFHSVPPYGYQHTLILLTQFCFHSIFKTSERKSVI